MKHLYKNSSSGSVLKSIGKLALAAVLIMVWILIDKGNVYGQYAISKSKNDAHQLIEQSLPMFKDGEEDSTSDLTGGEEGNTLNVYPNPVIQEMVFDFEFTVKSESPYEILDPQGKLIEGGIIEPGITQQTIDLGKLTSGMYLVRMELGGKPQVHRIIKH